MIDRVERLLRRARSTLSRSEWTARLLRLPRSEGTAAQPGLVVIQIDGLSRRQLEDALGHGRMPFLQQLLAAEGYRLFPVYSGMPSTTPAAQGEFFYGVRGAVPAFSFVDRGSGRIVRMYEAEPVTAIERSLAGRAEALLDGGSSYCNVYTGGAADPRFCMASLGWGDLLHAAHPLALPLLALAHAGDLARLAASLIHEVLLTPGGLVEGVRSGQDLRAELKFVQTRAVICVLLREMIAIGASVDVARGLPIVHLNLVGYDEYAHRRGPGSTIAQRSLTAIDAVIARLVRAARRSARRDYDVWVLSDHGQEATVSYLEIHGRSVQEVVAEVVGAHGLESQVHAEPREGIQRQRARVLGAALIRLLVPGLDVETHFSEPGRVVVTAQGPLGHVYTPRRLQPGERDALARDLVHAAHVPLVLGADALGTAKAWTAAGELELPRDAERLLGPDHPYLGCVARDLVEVCHHRDAGDLVISGWQRGAPALSFQHENAAHGGPGPQETDAFLVAPADAPLPAREGEPLRPLHLREAAFAVLGRSASRPVRRPSWPAAGAPLRILTYNVHSCVGMDGKLSPERIARVIARHAPDVVALQELDVGRARTGGVDQAAVIARQLEMLLHFHPAVSMEEERFGDAVLSRHPMRLVRAGPLPHLEGPLALEPRGAIWVEIEVDGRSLHVLNTHLGLDPREQRLQVEALLGPEWLGHSACAGAVVLCGDFNAPPWFPTCRRIAARLRDCQAGHADHRPRRTWSGRWPLGRIDHIFADPAIEILGADVPASELARVASDHLPLLVELRLPARDAQRTASLGGPPG